MASSNHTSSQLPAWVPNYDHLSCDFCKTRPKALVPKWTGPHIGGYCPKCNGRLGSASLWLKKEKYGLDLFQPEAKEDEGQEALFGDCA